MRVDACRERRRRPSRRAELAISLCFGFLATPVLSQTKTEALKDGVERAYIQEKVGDKSFLTRKFAEIYSIAIPNRNPLPFGRSIAFLVGVSEYRYLPGLPSVRNDIKDMRDFLLNKAGFDEVYTVMDNNVKRDLVEQYVKGTLPNKMAKGDRLLFYYSGHGGDNQGKTGYMLFGGARKGQFYGQDVLAIDALTDWSKELPVEHILFILDSCSSGLGLVPKSDGNNSESRLLETLSGNGSRTVLTAGTADEETYADEGRQRAGNSVFTKALLRAFDSRASATKNGFITVGDLFADVQKEMAGFRAETGKSTTPRMWALQELDYRGTFVFLNTHAIDPHLTEDQAKALHIAPKAGNSNNDAADLGFGTINVLTVGGGVLFLDGRDVGYAASGQFRDFEQQVAGLHKVELQGAGGVESNEVSVRNGGITYVAFGVKSPIDDSGLSPVGSLEIQSPVGLTGEVFLDDFPVGHMDRGRPLIVQNVKVGRHQYRVVGDAQTEGAPVDIISGQTAYSTPRPNPPSSVTITVK